MLRSASPQRLFPVAQIRRRRLQLRGSLGDAPLQFAIQPLQLPRLAKQIHEDADLGAQNLRNDRHRHVVDRAARVSLEPVEIGQMDAGDEDDRRLLKARVLAHHRRQLESVELRHADIDQDHGHVGVEQMIERLARGTRRNQRFTEPAEHRLVAQQLARLIVDEKNVRLVGACHR